MKMDNHIKQDILNYNILYYYFLYLSIFCVLFFILGIFILWKTKTIPYVIIIIIIIIFILFLENIGLFLCFHNNNNNNKEGVTNYECYKIFSQYSQMQYQIDQFDYSYNCLLKHIKKTIVNNNNYITQMGGIMSADGTITQPNTNMNHVNLQENVNSKMYTISQNLNPRNYNSISMLTTT